MRSACSAWMVAAVVVWGVGCNCCKDKPRDDKQVHGYDPAVQYPAWAYDAPFYYKPPKDHGDVGETVAPSGPGEPTHYFIRSRTLYIPHPRNTATTQPAGDLPEMGPRTTPQDLAPRVGVYWTDSHGQEWVRAGHFGLGQTHFAFPAENDGVYGFRLTGPRLSSATCSPATCSPPRPDVVYHVDTVPPEITVCIEPNLPAYRPNQSVQVHWVSQDENLAESPVSISACRRVGKDGQREWREAVRDQPGSGSTSFVVPADAEARSFKIRVDARDRAGNLGVTFTPVLLVNAGATTDPPAETARRPAPSGAPADSGIGLPAPVEDVSARTYAESRRARNAPLRAHRGRVTDPLLPMPTSSRARPARTYGPAAVQAMHLISEPIPAAETETPSRPMQPSVPPGYEFDAERPSRTGPVTQAAASPTQTRPVVETEARRRWRQLPFLLPNDAEAATP